MPPYGVTRPHRIDISAPEWYGSYQSNDLIFETIIAVIDIMNILTLFLS